MLKGGVWVPVGAAELGLDLYTLGTSKLVIQGGKIILKALGKEAVKEVGEVVTKEGLEMTARELVEQVAKVGGKELAKEEKEKIVWKVSEALGKQFKQVPKEVVEKEIVKAIEAVKKFVPEGLQEIAEKNALDPTWLDEANAAVKKLTAGRALARQETESTFLSLCKELGWSDEVAKKYADAILTLVDVTERSGYTAYGHTLRTMKYMDVVLREFPELSAAEKARMKLAALIHDVGKVGVDNNVWRKVGELKPLEREQIAKHADYTKDVLRQAFSSLRGVNEKEFQEIVELAAGHHLKPGQAKLGSQIMAILDHFDAATSPRVYRNATDVSGAFMQIKHDTNKFGKYDASLVDKVEGIIRRNSQQIEIIAPK
ncbi:MAG: HD domain-containing protein [Candidatus Micrarchaeia archaeon]